MTSIRTLLLTAAVLCLATPALAGDAYRWWPDQSVAASWACGAFEYRHRCNAELRPRTNRCGCIVR